jgi:hypothetical protein
VFLESVICCPCILNGRIQVGLASKTLYEIGNMRVESFYVQTAWERQFSRKPSGTVFARVWAVARIGSSFLQLKLG